MAYHEKKHNFERPLRKSRLHRQISIESANKNEKRHGWGYAKRRAMLSPVE
jgi:hypothetical protein